MGESSLLYGIYFIFHKVGNYIYRKAIAIDTNGRVIIMAINKLYPLTSGRQATKYTIATEIH